MKERKETGCCSGGSCCAQDHTEKNVVIDYLYLDLDTCTRCQDTRSNLEEALRDVEGVLHAAGFTVVLNAVHIDSRTRAIEYRFVSSPTIRVNGHDIAPEVEESLCEDCGDICGGSVDCRVWVEGDARYTAAPRSLIVDAILREVYGSHETNEEAEGCYELPPNLSAFFDALDKQENKTGTVC
jgi:hypothetical protein